MASEKKTPVSKGKKTEILPCFHISGGYSRVDTKLSKINDVKPGLNLYFLCKFF